MLPATIEKIPGRDGKRIAFNGPGRTVINGPFAATRELVAWVRRCPNPMLGPSEIEIRPFYEMSGFQR